MSKLFHSFYDVLMEDVIGDTSWHGETNADNRSIQNMEKVEVLLLKLLDLVNDNANLSSNAIGTISGQKLKVQAEKILKGIGS